MTVAILSHRTPAISPPPELGFKRSALAALSMSSTVDAHDEHATAPAMPAPQHRVLKSILRTRQSASFASLSAPVSTTSPAAEPIPPPPPPPTLCSATHSSLPPMPPRQQRSTLPPSDPSHSASRKRSAARPSSSSTVTSPPSIQPLKLTPSELESNLANLADTLCDTTTHDWTKRIAALQQLTAITLGCIPSFTLFLSHFRPLRSALSAQILDLRSSVVKETCATLSTLAQSAGDLFSDESDVFLPHLVRLVSVSVQVIASSGDDAIRTLLRFTRPRHALHKIIESCASSSAITRLRCMEYVLHWMVEWRGDAEYMSRWEAALERLIVDKLSDKTEGVRATARKAVVVFADVWPERGRLLLDGLDEKVRRLVESEKRQGEKRAEAETTASELQKTRSVSRKSVKGGGAVMAAVVRDKENSNPNTAPLPTPPPQPVKAATLQPLNSAAATATSRPPLAAQPVASIHSARRTSFTLLSVTAVDGELPAVGSSSGRLGGAQRVLPAALTVVASAQGLPPHPLRARRLSIVPFPASILPATVSPSVSSSSTSSSSTSAPPEQQPSSPPGVPASSSATLAPPLPVAGQPKTAYEALLSTTLASDLHTAIDVAFADLHRKPRPSTSTRRQSHALHNLAPLPTPQPEQEHNTPPPTHLTAPSTKRQSLGPLPSSSSSSSSASTKHPSRRSSLSLAPPAEAVAVPRPSVSSALLLVKDAGWQARVAALDSLTSMAAGWEGGGDLSHQFDRVVYTIVDRMTDPQHRVVGAALSSLFALLTSLSSHPTSPSPLLPHLSALFPPLLLTLSHQRLSLRQRANDSLNLLSLTVTQASLIGPLSLALTAKEGKVRRGAEEFLGYILSVGEEGEQRRKREVVEGLVGEAGKKARAVLQAMLASDAAADEPADFSEVEAERSPVDEGSEAEQAALLEPSVAEDEAKGEERMEEAAVVSTAEEVAPAAAPEEASDGTALLPLSLLLSPHHPINQPPSLPALLAPPTPPSPPPPQPSAESSLPFLSPMAAEALARFQQQQETQHRRTELLLPPASTSALYPASQSQSSGGGHSRTPPAPATRTQTAAKPSHRPHSASTSSTSSSSSSSRPRTTDVHMATSKSSQSSKRRVIMLSPPSSSQPSQPRAVSSPSVAHGGSSKVSRFDAYDGRLSDADVSALIYQWKHAEAAVVQQSLQWVEQLMAKPCTLPSPSFHRILLALLDTSRMHPTLTADVLAVLSICLSPTSPSSHLRTQLASPSFPHLCELLTFLLFLSHSTPSSDTCKPTVDSLWAATLTLHPPTLLTSLTSLLSTTPPTHRDSLTLLLTSLTSVLPHLTPALLDPSLPALAASLSVLLGHEWVMVRKHAVKVWVALWEVVGEGVDRWLEGLGGVSRKLVEIYLNKAREERDAKQGGQQAQR